MSGGSVPDLYINPITMARLTDTQRAAYNALMMRYEPVTVELCRAISALPPHTLMPPTAEECAELGEVGAAFLAAQSDEAAFWTDLRVLQTELGASIGVHPWDIG